MPNVSPGMVQITLHQKFIMATLGQSVKNGRWANPDLITILLLAMSLRQARVLFASVYNANSERGIEKDDSESWFKNFNEGLLALKSRKIKYPSALDCWRTVAAYSELVHKIIHNLAHCHIPAEHTEIV